MTLGEVILPWPPRVLWPNDRADRRRATTPRAKYRRDAWTLCLEAGLANLPHDAMHVAVTFCPPDLRRRDLDNMLAAIKAGLDGISLATSIDDSAWTLSIRRGAPAEGGCVLVRLEAPQGRA